MKLGSVTKLEKGNTTRSKKFDNDFMSVNYDFTSFFPFMVNLEQFNSRMPEFHE